MHLLSLLFFLNTKFNKKYKWSEYSLLWKARFKNVIILFTGYYKEYSPTCNPSIVNEFASAAFRIGHSLLRPHLPRLSPTYQPIDPPILLRDGFFKVDMFLQVNASLLINNNEDSKPELFIKKYIGKKSRAWECHWIKTVDKIFFT